MDAVLNWLWQGCIVALALFVMLRLLERTRASVRYAVCWAALLLVVALPAVQWLGSLGLRHDALGLPLPDAVVSVPDAWWTSDTVIAAAWTVWASAYAVRFAWAMVALRRARARSRAFPTQIESLLPHWRQLRREGRRPALVVSDAVTTAAVLGCGTPMIAVAPSLVTTLDADEVDRILIHEWAHVQRRDDLGNLLQVLVRIVVGWHPAAWWIDRRLHVEREIACDEMTVAVTGSPKSYAECLLKLASLNGAERTALAAPAMLTASGLRARVTRIVSRHAFVAPLWSRGIAAAIVSALCVVSVGVGGLRLVGARVLTLPLDSVRAIDAARARGLEAIAPVAKPAVPSGIESTSLPRQTVSRQSDRPPDVEEAPPDTPASAHAEAQPISQPQSLVDPPERHATVESGANTEVVPESLGVVANEPPQLSYAAVEDDRSLWSATADGGTVIGRKSKEAGVATAGFFSRFARRVAGSF